MADVKKKKRVSRNKKLHWRKHTDIKDVEEHLEEQRFEERTGGPVSAKPDEQLFLVDARVEKSKETDSSSKTRTRGKKRKHNDKNPKLRRPISFSVSVKPVITPQLKKVKSPPLWYVEKNNANTVVSKKIETGTENPLLSTWTPSKDLWAEGPVTSTDNYNKDIEHFYKQQTKELPVKLPSSRSTPPSLLPSVPAPHPGASYNPAYDDYQGLLLKAHKVEQKKKKERDYLNRVLTKKFPKACDAPNEKTWLAEMSQGLTAEPGESENEDSSSEITANPATRCERKLRSKKNREKKQKLELKTKEEEKIVRLRENDIYKLRQIKAEVESHLEKSVATELKRKKQEALKKYKTAKLSCYKYEAPDIELKLSNELTGSLRELKPEGALAVDRIKSFQRRNIIEPRVRQTFKRKYKLKRYTKKSHKEEV